MSASSSSSSSKCCYDSECGELKPAHPRKAWLLRTGDYAELCDRCAHIMASKQKFCSVDLWAVDERLLASIRGTGLEYFRDVARDLGNNQHSNDLVRALFAMYDSKNYCFSLSQSSRGNKPKKLFFGCEDIVYSIGLSVIGELVTNDKNHYAVVEGSGYRVDGLPPLKADTKLKGKHRSSISLKSLRKQFESVPITADEQQLEGHTNAYVLYLVGSVIVPTTNSYVPPGYLGSIATGKYRKSAWGDDLKREMILKTLNEGEIDERLMLALKLLLCLFWSAGDSQPNVLQLTWQIKSQWISKLNH